MTDPQFPNSNKQPLAPGMTRRGLMVGTAALAAAGGAVLAWRDWQQSPGAVLASAVEALWAMQWPTPQGGQLQMRSFKGRPLLLNFWATWCPPCVEELPRLNAFYLRNANAGWQVLGLAVDNLAPVQAFLKKMPLDIAVGLAGLQGIELARSFGNLADGLPFSVLIGADGAVLHRKMGQITEADLDAWIRLK